jgi:hypothetical protein
VEKDVLHVTRGKSSHKTILWKPGQTPDGAIESKVVDETDPSLPSFLTMSLRNWT